MANESLYINNSISIPHSEFDYRYVRSSGPGGQNVNKVNSKVMLRWPIRESSTLPDEVKTRFWKRFGNRITTEGIFIISSQLTRDQLKNKHDCLKKLSEMLLEVAVPPKKRKKRRISRSAIEKRIVYKKRRSTLKQSRKPPRLDD